MTHQTQRRRRRHSAVCHRHPTSKPTTGFCATCLRERLSTIEALSSSLAASDQAPELRRARSHSVRDASAAGFDQPRRRSCDVRSDDGSLHDRFSDDEEDEEEERVGSSIRIPMVPDLKEEEEEEDDDDEDIRGFVEGKASRRLLEEEIEDGEQKTMKEFIDLESKNHQTKKNNGTDLKDIASVFSRTLKKLSLKHQKNGKNPDAGNGDVYSKRRSETVLGRRSCDVDPRLSLDISFEEPRASWDGCLIRKTYPKMVPLSSVTEDAKASPEKRIGGEDDEEEKNPGGTAQTRDYYLDSRRRRSFDRSSRHGLLEVDELKAISNAKLSPETVGLFHGAKLLVTERELRDSNWYSIKNYKPESLELASKGVGCVAAGEVKQDGFGLKKTGKKWAKGWNLWGLIQRKTDAAKNEVKTEPILKLGGSAMEGSLAETLLKLRRVAKGDTNGDVSEKLIRSYSVSARKSCDGMFRGASIVNGFEGGRSSCDGLFHGSITGAETGRRRSCEDGLFHGIEGKQNHLLQRDAKLGTYSPDNLRNGMVRFYLTPLRSHVTSNSGKSRLMN